MCYRTTEIGKVTFTDYASDYPTDDKIYVLYDTSIKKIIGCFTNERDLAGGISFAFNELEISIPCMEGMIFPADVTVHIIDDKEPLPPAPVNADELDELIDIIAKNSQSEETE